jgi:hypothetical protein
MEVCIKQQKEQVAGTVWIEEGAETIPRKREKRGDGRNVCRNRNCVQETSRERRLQELCAGNSRKETMSMKPQKRGDGRECAH